MMGVSRDFAVYICNDLLGIYALGGLDKMGRQ